jgi:hypothetical protein
MRQIPNEYGYKKGDYGIPNRNFLKALACGETTRQLDQFRGLEVTIENAIWQLLESKTNGPHPVVVLDVGAMLGLTAHKLARHFQKQIQDNQLLILLNNLETTPLKLNKPPKEEDFIYKIYNEGIIHYLQEHVVGLFKTDIGIKDHANLPLRGNVDLIIDINAIALHSQVPTLHIPLLGLLLSEYGMYITNTSQGDRRETILPNVPGSLDRAWNILQNDQGLERVSCVEWGDEKLIGKPLTHVVMRIPQGPRIYASDRQIRLQNT